MAPPIIAALIGLLGVIVGAIPTYLFMRQKNFAEIDKLKAEAEKIRAEAEKIRVELSANKSFSVKENRIKVLFVPANPMDTARLNLDDEVRGIKESFRRASQNAFELDSIWGSRWDELRSHLLRNTPDVLHISGHGGSQGISFGNEEGRESPITAEVLSKLLLLFSDKIRLVVLNTSCTEEMCKTLAQNIDFVIGGCGSLNDKLAAKFPAALYEALADGKDIKSAFEFARASIGESTVYQLYTLRKQSEKYYLLKEPDKNRILLTQ